MRNAHFCFDYSWLLPHKINLPICHYFIEFAICHNLPDLCFSHEWDSIAYAYDANCPLLVLLLNILFDESASRPSIRLRCLQNEILINFACVSIWKSFFISEWYDLSVWLIEISFVPRSDNSSILIFPDMLIQVSLNNLFTWFNRLNWPNFCSPLFIHSLAAFVQITLDTLKCCFQLPIVFNSHNRSIWRLQNCFPSYL